MDPERLINIIVTVAIFTLIFSVWCICIFLWLGQYLIRLRSVQQRLGIAAKETDETRTLKLWRERGKKSREGLSPVKLTLKERLRILRNSAGWKTTAYSIILRLIGVTILAFVITYLSSRKLTLSFIVAIVIIAAFYINTKMRIKKNAALFERQLLDALGISARALRAGLPLLGSFQLISEEIGKPIGDIFGRICREQLVGLDLDDSIRKVSKDYDNQELKLFSTSVAIQLRSGGNLADLMDSLALVIRVRIRLNRRVRVLISQTQLSKRILIALPVLLFLFLNFLSPEYMQMFYTTTIGKILFIIMVVMVSFGAWVMDRMSVLKI